MLDDSFFAPDCTRVDLLGILRGKRTYRLLGLLGHIFMMWWHLVRHYNMNVLFSNWFMCTFISNLVTTRLLLLFLLLNLLLLKLVLLLPRGMLIISVVTLFFILSQLNCTYYNCVLSTSFSSYVSRSL